MREVNALRGHHSDGSSVQNHSVGSNYPYIVRLQEYTREGVGYADVLDSLGAIRSTFGFSMLVDGDRLRALRLAYDRADQLAAIRRIRRGAL